jgi:hypothetical protein
MMPTSYPKASRCNQRSKKSKNPYTLNLYRADLVPFQKMLPRDNKMFFISEAHNLDNKPLHTPMIGRMQLFDNVKEIINVMHNRG